VLKNVCDENFRLTQLRVKDTVIKMMKEVVREKMPLKSQADV
jgi:hypothetical protein